MLHTLDRLLRWSTGLLSALALFAIMLLTVVDVSGRKFLSHSVPGGLELTEVLMVVVIFGALPLVSWRGEHVVFDSLDPFVPRWLQRVQQRLVHAVCALAFGVMAWLMVLRGDRFAEYGDITVHLQLPLTPVAWMMAAFLGVTALVHAVFVVVRPPDRHAHAAPAPGDAP